MTIELQGMSTKLKQLTHNECNDELQELLQLLGERRKTGSLCNYLMRFFAKLIWHFN